MNPGFSGGRTLDLSGQKGRYGVTYLRNVCAQFGVGFKETSTDEDMLAIDGTIEFPALGIRVQVKCTKKDFNQSGYISWQVKEAWKKKWEQSMVPCYFIVVRVPESPSDWIDYDDGSATLHRTTAHWTKIDVPDLGASIRVDESNRLTPTTLEQWNTELVSRFSGSGIAS